MRRTLAALAVTTLVLAACSSDGSSDTDAVVDTEPAETDTTEPVDTEPVDTATVDTEPDAINDQALADAALLVADDFPAGWVEVPDSEDDVTPAVEDARAAFRACFGSEGDDLTDLGGARAETGEFTGPDDQTVANVIGIADDAAADEVMARYGAEGVEDCLTQRAAELIEIGFAENPDAPADLEIGTVTVERLDVAPAGDEIIAFRVLVPISTGGQTFDATMDQVVVRVGRGLSGLEFSAVGGVLTADDVDTYVALSVERLTEALDQG